MDSKLMQVSGIRTFSDANIQKAIDQALTKLPSGHTVAAVAHADLNGASVSLVVKLGDKWSVMAGAYQPYKGKLSAEAEVIWSPF
jgi:hypothetical protein